MPFLAAFLPFSPAIFALRIFRSLVRAWLSSFGWLTKTLLLGIILGMLRLSSLNEWLNHLAWLLWLSLRQRRRQQRRLQRRWRQQLLLLLLLPPLGLLPLGFLALCGKREHLYNVKIVQLVTASLHAPRPHIGLPDDGASP